MTIVAFANDPGAGGIRQSDVPSEWSCDSDIKKVRVEVKLGENWIEIPTTSVETWIVKGQAASIQRSAKVEFPTSWAGMGVRDLIETYLPDEGEHGMMQARIQFQQQNGTWVYVHNGWVNGIGQSGTTGISKFWIRDFAELLGGVPVTGTFNHPSVQEALGKIAELTQSRSSIPIDERVLLVPPESEEEFAQLTDSDFDGVHFFFSESGTPMAAEFDDFLELGIATRAIEDTPSARIPIEEFSTGRFEVATVNTGRDLPVLGIDTKAFVRNRDTLLDMYKWFEKKTQCKLHFEPTGDGENVRLVADIVPERRRFVQDEVLDSDLGPETAHQPVTVLKNEALLEINPINTVHLRGQVSSGLLDDAQDLIGDAIASLTGSAPPSDKFPMVKVQDPALVEAAGGVELASETIESDATNLDTAEQEAIKALAEKLEGFSEGEVNLLGTPMMLPFDRLDAFETCERYVEFQQLPITYEIEEVKHTKRAGGFYETRVKVSIWANEQTFETPEKKMVPIDGRPEAEKEADNIQPIFGLPVGGWF